MESLFGHMKDKMDYKEVHKFEVLKQLVNQYMIFYNHQGDNRI
ncbi:IS3 family transposase [Heyndrickxia oleronia]|jgi:hypothetical protein|nr:IS3 family transposase [Heyndrickxia oleronia]MCI1760444.1 IS3 family transposase [Heyndrickxia oleronia]